MRPDSYNERDGRHVEALQRAMRAVQDERAIDAERIASEILKINAGHLGATKIMGYALLMQGKAQEAIAPLMKAARASHNPEIETQLAIALRQAGEREKALIWLKRAIKRTPPFAPAFYEFGCVLHSLEQTDEAIAVFKQGIAVAPMMTDLWIQLGFVYSDIKDRANARDVFAHALAINPRYPEAIHGLASVLMDESNFAQAAELLQCAVAEDPNDTMARIGLGHCLLELGQQDTAYACLRAAAVRVPSLHNVLGAVLMSGHGRFWLRPSGATKFFKGGGAIGS